MDVKSDKHTGGILAWLVGKEWTWFCCEDVLRIDKN